MVFPGKGQWLSIDSGGKSGFLSVFQAPRHVCSTKQVNKKYTGLILSEFISEQAISPSIFAIGTCYISLDNSANMRTMTGKRDQQ